MIIVILIVIGIVFGIIARISRRYVFEAATISLVSLLFGVLLAATCALGTIWLPEQRQAVLETRAAYIEELEWYGDRDITANSSYLELKEEIIDFNYNVRTAERKSYWLPINDFRKYVGVEEIGE